MCFDTDSAPPIPVITGAAVSHDDLVLEASDGNTFAAFLATPDEASKVGVVILPDVRGLYRFYEELALRFAERGYAACAIDYFGRTAGIAKREDDWDYMAEVEKTRQATVAADTRAAVERLRAEGCTSIFTVGFCFGGSNSWLQAAEGHGLAGAVGFYGSPTRERFGESSVIARVGEIDAPILALQGGADAGITHEDNEAFGRALTEGGVEHEIVEFEGAPHSFFDRKQEEFKDASDDAWRRTLAFIDSRS
jgi:carboxymethylenebutenolidase